MADGSNGDSSSSTPSSSREQELERRLQESVQDMDRVLQALGEKNELFMKAQDEIAELKALIRTQQAAEPASPKAAAKHSFFSKSFAKKKSAAAPAEEKPSSDPSPPSSSSLSSSSPESSVGSPSEKDSPESDGCREERIMVLEKQIKDLQTGNDSLMEIVAAKDAAKIQLEIEFEETTNRLRRAQKEMSESEAARAALEAQVKDLESKNKKLCLQNQRSESLGANAKNLQTQLAALTAKLAEAEESRKLAEKQLAEANQENQNLQHKLDDKDRSIQSLENSNNVVNRSLEEYKQMLSDMEDDHQQSLQIKAEEWKMTELELQNIIESLRAELNQAKEHHGSELSTAQTELQKNKDIIAKFEIEISELTAEKKENSQTRRRLEEELESTKAAVEEAKSNSAIENKKLRQLVKSLQEELKKNIVKINNLEVALQQSKAELPDIQNRLRQDRSSPRRDASQEDLQPSRQESGGLRSHRISRSLSVVPHPPNLPPSSPQLSRPQENSSEQDVLREVNESLTLKLANAEDENERMTKRLQSLEEELRKQKMIYQNHLRMVETGALTTSQMVDEQQKKGKSLFGTGKKNLQQELFHKMEVVMQETTLINIQQRETIKKLGKTVTELAARVKELEGSQSSSGNSDPSPDDGGGTADEEKR